MHPGYTSLLLLLGYIVFKVAPPAVVLGMWTTPMMYLIIGSYIMASAVNRSGLGKRLAYIYATRYIRSYTSLIIGAYVLGFLLSIFIPLSFARSFLIMSVLVILAKDAKMPTPDIVNLGVAVFAGSVPVSLILLTGDSVLSMMAIGMSGQSLGWVGWVQYMSIPGIVATLITIFVHLKIYKPRGNFQPNKERMLATLTEMGPVKPVEWRTLFWCVVTVVGWMTESLHGIHPGWVSIGTAIFMALPFVGGAVGPASWNDVPLGILLFVLAALSIGKVGDISGMNMWLANSFLPSVAPDNIFLFGAIIAVVGIILHMCIGSVMAVLSVTIPAFVAFGVKAGLNPLIPALFCFTVVYSQYLLPFHHMNILVGVGEKQGGFTDKDILRLGLPLSVIPFILVLLVEIPLWKLFGFL